MIPQKQKICSKTKGDCFRACIASILEMDIDSLPNPKSEMWLMEWRSWFQERGMRLDWDHEKIWREGYWIASVPSKNYKDVYHAIVMKDHWVEFDPSTKKRYRKGNNMLRKDLITFGYWIELDDISKLKEFLKGEKQ